MRAARRERWFTAPPRRRHCTQSVAALLPTAVCHGCAASCARCARLAHASFDARRKCSVRHGDDAGSARRGSAATSKLSAVVVRTTFSAKLLSQTAVLWRCGHVSRRSDELDRRHRELGAVKRKTTFGVARHGANSLAARECLRAAAALRTCAADGSAAVDSPAPRAHAHRANRSADLRPPRATCERVAAALQVSVPVKKVLGATRPPLQNCPYRYFGQLSHQNFCLKPPFSRGMAGRRARAKRHA